MRILVYVSSFILSVHLTSNIFYTVCAEKLDIAIGYGPMMNFKTSFACIVDDSTDINEESTPGVDETDHSPVSNIGTNVLTSFNEEVESPDIDPPPLLISIR